MAVTVCGAAGTIFTISCLFRRVIPISLKIIYHNYHKMKEGTVKFFNETKGFGFVKETATGQEYFVHVSGLLVDNIREKDEVTFELKEGKKGLNAVNVRLANQ
jgi:cold shock protein